MNDLKRDIAMNRYEIDAGAVAAAIISRLAVLRRSQEALRADGAGRSPKPPQAPRRPL